MNIVAILAPVAMALVCLLSASNAVGATDDTSGIVEVWTPPAASARVRYEKCIANTFIDPADAILDARAWFISERTAAARHCEAKALIALNQFTEAAVLLSELAFNSSPAEVSIKSALFAQAGNAWLLANDAE